MNLETQSDETNNLFDPATMHGLYSAARLGITGPDSPMFIAYIYGVLEMGAVYNALQNDLSRRDLTFLSMIMAEVSGNAYVESKNTEVYR